MTWLFFGEAENVSCLWISKLVPYTLIPLEMRLQVERVRWVKYRFSTFCVCVFQKMTQYEKLRFR